MKRHLNHVFSGETIRPNGYRYSFLKLHEAFDEVGVELTRGAKHALIHGIPGTTSTVGDKQTRSILTMWESSQLPAAFETNLHRFEHVFVPTESSRALMEPFNPNVHVVGLGVDPRAFFPRRTPRADGPFTVLTFGHGRRKGITELLEAWERVKLPDARLIVKNDARGPKWRAAPGVEHLRATVSDEQIRGLYHQADLYISCSYGEGYDLPAAQAIACGVPTVVPAHTAYLDYIEFAAETLTKHTPAESLMRIFGPCGTWLVPSVDEIAEVLVAAHAERERWAVDAKDRGAEFAVNNDWWMCAERILSCFDDLGPADAGADTDVVFMVPVRAVRDLPSYDIGGGRGRLVTGDRYTLSADAARVLVEAGYVEVDRG